MSNPFAPIGFGGSTIVAATGTSADEAITVPSGANTMHIANTSATLYVSVRWGVGALTALLGTDLSLPPMSQIVVAIPSPTSMVAAIASGAGPTSVIFTPGNGGI